MPCKSRSPWSRCWPATVDSLKSHPSTSCNFIVGPRLCIGREVGDENEVSSTCAPELKEMIDAQCAQLRFFLKLPHSCSGKRFPEFATTARQRPSASSLCDEQYFVAPHAYHGCAVFSFESPPCSTMTSSPRAASVVSRVRDNGREGRRKRLVPDPWYQRSLIERAILSDT